MFCDIIDQIIDFNKTFVAQKGYEKYLTDKYPWLFVRASIKLIYVKLLFLRKPFQTFF